MALDRRDDNGRPGVGTSGLVDVLVPHDGLDGIAWPGASLIKSVWFTLHSREENREGGRILVAVALRMWLG